MPKGKSEIPADILAAARDALMLAITAARSKSADEAIKIIADALLAEREACAKIADQHAHQCVSKLNKKRSDHDLAVFESAASEASSIAASIRSSSLHRGEPSA